MSIFRRRKPELWQQALVRFIVNLEPFSEARTISVGSHATAWRIQFEN